MIWAFWVVSISLVLVPGPDWAYAISAGMRGRAVWPAVAGILLGYVGITAVVAAGVGALVTGTPAILTVLTLAGAAYLLWLGGNVILHPPVPTNGAQGHESRPAGWVARGFMVSGLNPKALLLCLALLPQFTRSTAAWPVAVQIGALGAIQIVNCALVYSLVGVGAGLVLRRRPRLARWIGRLSGVAMVTIGLILLGEQIGMLG